MNSKTQKGIVAFLVIAFGLAWIMWGVLFSLGITPRNPRFQLWGTFPGFAPAISAIIVRKWVTHEGFADAGLRPNLRAWRYYLLAWLFPLGIGYIIIGLAVMFRISMPDPTYQRAFQILFPDSGTPAIFLSVPPPFVGMLTSLIMMFLICGEEFGWRGYLQIRLFADRPALAGLATGLIWGVWHTPMILVSGDQYAATPLLGVFVFTISAMLLSVIWGWLRIKTGSVWISCLAHAATNSLGSGMIMVPLFYGGPNWTFLAYYGVLAWIPLGLICLWLYTSGQLKGSVSS